MSAKEPDELVQLAENVGHIVIDEGQEIPFTWIVRLGEKMPRNVGLTLFYDLNQLGGNIPNNDTKRYERRISDWKTMTARFPRMQKYMLSINYRNSREIAEYYLSILEKALPAKPSADVPVFEAGEVIRHQVRKENLHDTIASILRQLQHSYNPSQIGVVLLDQWVDTCLRTLLDRKFAVSADFGQDSTIVTNATRIRGHERQVMVVTIRSTPSQCWNYGIAINVYIAMSRAIKQLIVLEFA